MANANMQIADWIAGALARYLEKRPLGELCAKILKNNVIGDPKEFFTDSLSIKKLNDSVEFFD